MPDPSSNGSPDDLPDASTGNPSNSDPDSKPDSTPRIAPPEGARAARGQFSDDEESLDVEESFNSEELAFEKSAEPALTVADTPAVEDSYEPPFAPLDVDPALDFASHSSSSDEDASSWAGAGARPDTPKDVELGLMAHLGELRQRLLYCAIILMAGMALTWNYSQPMQEWFAEPIRNAIGKRGVIQSIDPTGFFMITVQFSLVAALIITAPLLFWQVWLFIEPALTKAERRYSLIVVPFASVLFFSGAGLSYLVSPLFFKFFLAFQPEGVAANWDYGQSVVLMAKMLLAFGVMFQVPVIVIFLNKLGLLSRNVLIEYWRHAVIVIFTVAAIVTPTWDPVTLAVCATPPCLLYLLSIWLVKWL